MVEGGSPSCTKCSTNPLLGAGQITSLLPDHILVKQKTFTDNYKGSTVNAYIILTDTMILSPAKEWGLKV